MSLSKFTDTFQFTKLWTDPNAFPTVETDETKIRQDMQALHDETKEFINDEIKTYLNTQVQPAVTQNETNLATLKGRVDAVEPTTVRGILKNIINRLGGSVGDDINTYASAASNMAVPVASGGTGKKSWTANGLVYPSNATTMAQVAIPTADESFLTQSRSGAPFWTPYTTLANKILTSFNNSTNKKIMRLVHDSNLTKTLERVTPTRLLVGTQNSGTVVSTLYTTYDLKVTNDYISVKYTLPAGSSNIGIITMIPSQPVIAHVGGEYAPYMAHWHYVQKVNGVTIRDEYYNGGTGSNLPGTREYDLVGSNKFLFKSDSIVVEETFTLTQAGQRDYYMTVRLDATPETTILYTINLEG